MPDSSTFTVMNSALSVSRIVMSIQRNSDSAFFCVENGNVEFCDRILNREVSYIAIGLLQKKKFENGFSIFFVLKSFVEKVHCYDLKELEAQKHTRLRFKILYKLEKKITNLNYSDFILATRPVKIV